MTTATDFLPAFPLPLGRFFWLALALSVAGLLGEAVHRWARLPRITGYVLAGLAGAAIPASQLDPALLEDARILVDVALGLLLFELGARLPLRWLRANPWIVAASLAESVLGFAAVFAALAWLGVSPAVAAAAGVVALSTSPAIVLQVTGEARAQGQVTERLLTHAALNSLYALVAAKGMLGWLHRDLGASWTAAILHPAYLLCGSLLIGLALAWAFRRAHRWIDLREERSIALLLGLLLLAMALSEALRLSAMMTALLAGVMVRNLEDRPWLAPTSFGTVGRVLVVLLFVLTGTGIRWEDVLAGGLAAVVLTLSRVAGKSAGVALFAAPGGLSARQAVALGLALTPLSGVAFVLAGDMNALYPEFGRALLSIVLGAVVVHELATPLVLLWVLRWARELPGRGS